MKDIELYYPKLIKGGVIGGRDFNCPDIARAIIEYAVKHNLKVDRSYCLPRMD